MMAQTTLKSQNHAVAFWLLAICALVAAMILVGGATRLTDSGLSITQWNLVVGMLPPLTQFDWLGEFQKYQQIPEFQLVNFDMGLDDFKTIYWWEWGHRFLGRMVGFLFFFPLIWFWLRGRLPVKLKPKLVALLLLGGLQGLLGWYMVKSGLVDRVDVSQYRLAAHLGLAFIIIGFAFWLALGLVRGAALVAEKTLNTAKHIVMTLLGLIFVQILLGAFVAGLDAGMIYNTWPDMLGALIPPGLYQDKSFVTSVFEDLLAVQFNHRMMAYVIVIVAAAYGLWALLRAGIGRVIRRSLILLLAVVLAQVVLGIWTLVEGAPIELGLMHQAGAVTTFLAGLYHLHCLKYQ